MKLTIPSGITSVPKQKKSATQSPSKTILELEAENAKLKQILRHIFPEKAPGNLFICGYLGKKDDNGLPDYLEICPTYGADWIVLYKKVETTIS